MINIIVFRYNPSRLCCYIYRGGKNSTPTSKNHKTKHHIKTKYEQRITQKQISHTDQPIAWIGLFVVGMVFYHRLY